MFCGFSIDRRKSGFIIIWRICGLAFSMAAICGFICSICDRKSCGLLAICSSMGCMNGLCRSCAIISGLAAPAFKPAPNGSPDPPKPPKAPRPPAPAAAGVAHGLAAAPEAAPAPEGTVRHVTYHLDQWIARGNLHTWSRLSPWVRRSSCTTAGRSVCTACRLSRICCTATGNTRHRKC